MIAPLAKRLEFHRIRCGNPTSGVMFPNLNGSPMDLGNVLNRAILPTLNRCAICGRPKDDCGKPKKGRPQLHPLICLRGTRAVPSGTDGTQRAGAWEPTCIGWACPRKRVRRFSAMRMFPRPTPTTSKAPLMTPAQRWQSSKVL